MFREDACEWGGCGDSRAGIPCLYAVWLTPSTGRQGVVRLRVSAPFEMKRQGGRPSSLVKALKELVEELVEDRRSQQHPR